MLLFLPSIFKIIYCPAENNILNSDLNWFVGPTWSGQPGVLTGIFQLVKEVDHLATQLNNLRDQLKWAKTNKPVYVGLSFVKHCRVTFHIRLKI